MIKLLEKLKTISDKKQINIRKKSTEDLMYIPFNKDFMRIRSSINVDEYLETYDNSEIYLTCTDIWHFFVGQFGDKLGAISLNLTEYTAVVYCSDGSTFEYSINDIKEDS